MIAQKTKFRNTQRKLTSIDVLGIAHAVHRLRANLPLGEQRRLRPILAELAALRREVSR